MQGNVKFIGSNPRALESQPIGSMDPQKSCN
jgi:hypothetical protein